MEWNWETGLPVYGVEGDCILSRQGDYTVAFKVNKPELFTLSEQEYDILHQALVKAVRVLPADTVVHLQDWYIQDRYRADRGGTEKTWLAEASERYFDGRQFADHQAFLFLTKKPAGRRPSSSALSGLLRSHLVPAGSMDKEAVTVFLGCCGQFQRILEDSHFFKLEQLGRDEIWSHRHKAGLIERYCSLGTGETPILKDVRMGNGLEIGEQLCQLFTLGDAEDLPPGCSPSIVYDPYSTDRTRYPVGFASGLGLLLPCNHIVNQYIFIEDAAAMLKKMERRRLRLQSLSAHSRENAISHAATDRFLNEAVEEQRLPVKVHMNILTWTDDKRKLAEIRNMVSAAMAKMEISPRMEVVGAPQIWWAGIPGNAGDFPMNECFDTFVEQAVCFFQLETNYRPYGSAFGFRLGDRITGRPVHTDIDDEPRSAGITANGNMVVLSGSGGGKSFFINHLVREYYERGTHVLIVDMGHSYEMQCKLHGGYYFAYEESKPISFNPFYLGVGDVMDTEKKESIKTLLLALWKKWNEEFNRVEYVALSVALKQYFDKLHTAKSIFPCFDSFYEFLRDEFCLVLQADGVKDRDFDLANFLYVLRPYYRGGEYDYLLNARENLDLLEERFIVFDLDNIKDHSVLFPVVTLIIMELFVSKMRKLKGIRKMIVIEEAWKAIARQGMAEYVKYLFKTVRKFFAKAVVVTQEVEDVISSEVVKQAIINNADIKVLLDQSKFQNKFDQLQELLGITDKQKAEILSINKGHEPGSFYKDLWIGLGPVWSKVYRLEVSPEEYYIYTSDHREKQRLREFINKTGSVKDGVRLLLASLKTVMPVLFFLLLAPTTKAQDIPIIGTVISKVVKALDLQVQRIQTQTIWLEEAQKVLENTMSQLDLDEIRGWVQAQKDLYDDYFQELRQVKPAVADYHRVTEIIREQEQIVAVYNQVWNQLKSDPHFTPQELAYMQAVYGGILQESAKDLDLLVLMTDSTSLQMSDEQRLAAIDKAGTGMDRILSDLIRFNNQNLLLSRQRVREAGEIDLLKKLYGL
ncbi:MAG TPA: TraG family conjugative transposon ATPase [Puia sp.]|jgi:conjugation system TraG family ATPase